MADIHTQTAARSHEPEKSREGQRPREAALEPMNELGGEAAVFESLLATPAMGLPVERHAATLNDARFSHPANAPHKAHMVSQLQRQYGNGYVQRVLDTISVQPTYTFGSDAGPQAPESIVQPQTQDEGAHELYAGPLSDTAESAPGDVGTHMPAPSSDHPIITQQHDRPVIARLPDAPGATTEEEELEELMEQAAPGELDLEELLESYGEETPLGEAEFRAGTPSEEWPELETAQRTEIRGLISSGQRQGAVDRLWDLLSLPQRGTVNPTPQVTTELGIVDGVPVSRGGALTSGLCIPYVVATTACAGCPESEHWQRHNNDELRAIIQIHNRVFERSPAEAVGQLISTVMHEYTHVQQMLDEGLHEGIAFATYPPGSRAAVGEREFLTFAGSIPPAERRRMGALQEVDAVCSEIENLERTGLTGLGLHGVVNYLWDNYRQYNSSLGGNPPDRAVEDRTYQSLRRGRQRFVAYLAQSTHPPAHRQYLLARCPENYDPSLMSGRVLTGAAAGEHTETESE